MAIPFFSVDFRKREWCIFLKAVLAGHLREGSSIAALERFISERYKSYNVILLPSARMGFYMLLDALFKEGDEVIVPAMGFPLYVLFMIKKGIKPIFVDVEPEHYTIDHEKIKDAVTSKTKAIVVTHLFGHPAQMDGITQISKSFGIPIIEDCAQSYNSFFKGQETGTFGFASLISCSIMKVPTTLGGGILITKDKDLYLKIRKRLEDPEYNHRLKKTSRYFIFNLISIMNSYPLFYSVLSHNIFGIIKKRRPDLLRKILYSGFGIQNEFYLWERPRLSNYQAAVGLVQFKRAEEMEGARRRYAGILDEGLRDVDTLILPKENSDCRWNYQYYVVHAKDGTDKIFDRMYSRGIHLMREDVWDCTAYEFSKEFYRECPVASSRTPGLIRIQNNSLLREKDIRRIGNELRQIALEK